MMQREVSGSRAKSREEGTSNLVEAVYRNVELWPERAALGRKTAGEWETISYREMGGRVRAFAAGLGSLGVGRGSRVALMSKNRPRWPTSDLAIQSLGAATVPIYPTLEGGQVAHILEDSEARIAIAEDEELLGRIQSVRNRMPELQHVIVIDDAFNSADEFALRFRYVEQAGRENPLDGWEERWRALTPEDVATIIYTSGTTGLPKGAVLTHGNILSNLDGMMNALPLTVEDTYLSFLPLSHVFERTCGQFLALSMGATIYYAESTDKVAENLREVKPTVMPSVPRLYEKMYDRVQARIASGSSLRRRLFRAAMADGRRRYAIEKEGNIVGRGLGLRLKLWDRLVFRRVREAVGGRVRFFVAGSAKLSAKVGEFFYATGVKIIEGYGLTETSPVIACNRLEKTRFGTVGLPLYNVEVKISADGEILTCGPHVMQGYLNNEKANAEAFTEDGWFHTGDVGEFDEHGYLRVTDRAKNLIVLSTGKNVAPQLLEAALAAAPHISQSVLVGDGRKYISALVVPDYGAVRQILGLDTSNEALAEDERVKALIWEEIEAATADFADYERPKEFVLLPRELSQEEGELTPTLKVKLRVIRERYGESIERMYL